MHIYFDVWSAIINSPIFSLFKKCKVSFLTWFLQDCSRKKSAIYQNCLSNCTKIKHFAFMCTNCIRAQINLHHLERRRQICSGCKFLKPRSYGQKYTPGVNLQPGCKLRTWTRLKIPRTISCSPPKHTYEGSTQNLALTGLAGLEIFKNCT